MTTRNPSRRFPPSLPSGKHIGLALASAAVGMAIGAAIVSQPFQDLFESENSTASVASVPQASTNIAPNSGITNDSVQPSAQERKLSPTGVNGFRDFDPDIVVPNGPSASANAEATRKLSPNGTNGFRDFDPDVVTPNLDSLAASLSQDETRKLSPNGTNGMKDFDPAVTFPGSGAEVGVATSGSGNPALGAVNSALEASSSKVWSRAEFIAYDLSVR